jgi:hypothetical protein
VNESSFLGYGFGEVKAGEKVIIVTTSIDEEADIYVEAIERALEEREVQPIIMHDYEIVGVTLQEARELSAKMIELGLTSNSSRGWTEGCNFFNHNSYLKSDHPDLFDLCNPPDLESLLPGKLFDIHQKMATARRAVPTYINKYMDDNPDIRGVFYGRGGPIWQQFQPNERWLGLFRFDNMWTALSPKSEFPADVWLMSEELTIEPATATDKVTVTNPMGLDAWWDLTEDQAQRWARGVYLRGHMFMFPNEAYGTYGLNTTRYPAQDTGWIPINPIVKLNGTVVGHASHAGFYPRVEQVWEDGYLKEVRGGGIYGELMRALMDMPGIDVAKYPLRDEPGFFWHFETALGTNPKGLRPDITKQRVSAERERDGVLHWGLGIEHWHDPNVPEVAAQSLPEYERKNKLPANHGFHIHTYLNTINLRIRGTEKWITVVDKGRSTSLDNPEVRALASRYGDPDRILATEWIPELPGINAPGDYDEFANDPYTYNAMVMEKIKSGTYDTYNPRVHGPN